MRQSIESVKEEMKESMRESMEGVKANMDRLEEMVQTKLEKNKQEMAQLYRDFENKMQHKNDEFYSNTKQDIVDINNSIYKNSENIQKVRTEIKNNNKEVLGKIKYVNDRLEINTNSTNEIINEKDEENKNKFITLENKIREIEENGLKTKVETTYIGLCQNVQNNNKFEGNIKKLHPIVFIKILKNKINNKIKGEEMKDIIRQHLVNQPCIWFNSQENNIQTFEDFENLFIRQYWGENAQLKIRDKLQFGKFDECRSQNYNNYAIQLYATAQYLQPKMREDEMVGYISRHFRQEIFEIISMHEIKK
nr:uncharacterized protein LOC111509030 [Leptinotarsa decemlineata]